MSESERLNAVLKSVHTLACHRYVDAEEGKVRIVLGPNLSDTPEGQPKATTPGTGGLAASCQWEANVYWGGGKWGNVLGVGPEPTQALESLHLHLLKCHVMSDARRSAVRAHAEGLVESEGLGELLASSPSATAPRSVSCHPVTREPDGYVTVDAAGEVLVGGQPLAQVEDRDVLLWAAQVVPVFLATGQRAPVPG